MLTTLVAGRWVPRSRALLEIEAGEGEVPTQMKKHPRMDRSAGAIALNIHRRCQLAAGGLNGVSCSPIVGDLAIPALPWVNAHATQ